MPEVPRRVLRSLKFPGIANTYNIPQLAEEYDPSYYYYYGSVCTYNGQLYICTYEPKNEYVDDFITGPFNSLNWYPISQNGEFAQWVSDYLNYDLIQPYEPYSSYRVGDCISFRDVQGGNNYVFICTRDTPDPASDFNYNFWFELRPDDWSNGIISNSISGIYQEIKYEDSNSQFSTKSSEKLLSLSTTEWHKENYDSDTGEFEFAWCLVDVEEGFDYLLSFRDYDKDGNSCPLFSHVSIMYLPVVNDGDDADLSDDWPDDVPSPIFNSFYHTLSYIGSRDWRTYDYIAEEECYWDESYVARLRMSDEYPFTHIFIAVQDAERVWDSSTERYLDQTYPLNDSEFESSMNCLALVQLKSSDSANMTEISKLVQQDYTEVYKSLKDSIVTYDDTNLYTDSVKIPLNEGNIALQFININDAWNDIDIELRVYSNKFGTNESIKLRNKDKHIYIIDKNMGSNGELIEWDYFKLRFRYQNSYLDSSQISFVNQTLNILRKPKTQSNPNPIIKNDSMAVNEFITLARSYLKAQDIYEINQPTFLQTSCDYQSPDLTNFNIDSATFVEACLRGLSFDNTPYSANWIFPWFDDYLESGVAQ